MKTKLSKAAPKRPRASKAKPKPRTPTHHEIAERAYFIHLEGTGSGELENWLRAERELIAA